MRLAPLFLAASLQASLLATEPDPPHVNHFTASLLGGSAHLHGHFTCAGDEASTDLLKDLGLPSATAVTGASLAFHTGRFRISACVDQSEASVTHVIPRELVLGKVRYPAGEPISSQVDGTMGGLVGSYLLISTPEAWLGADLGCQKWLLKITTQGTGYLKLEGHRVPWLSYRSTDNSTEDFAPSAGISGGLVLMDQRLILEGLLQVGVLNGGYTSYLSAQAHYYVFPHFGLRLHLERRTASLGHGSSGSDLTSYYFSREALGLGVVARW